MVGISFQGFKGSPQKATLTNQPKSVNRETIREMAGTRIWVTGKSIKLSSLRSLLNRTVL